MKFAATLALISAAIASISASSPIVNEQIDHMFDNWKVEHSKVYSSTAEHESKKSTFISNVEKIAEHNAAYERGEVSYTLALNHMADMTHNEYMDLLNTDPVDDAAEIRANAAFEHKRPAIRPMYGSDSIDWRTLGAVTSVKNQGQCGSCWSFSTAGAIEGAHFLATNELVSLSEQMLLDCVQDGGFKCNTGGNFMVAFNWVAQHGGIVSERTDPYTARQGYCSYSYGYTPAATISNYAAITSNDEAALLSAIKQQPVAIAIDASARDFQFYSSGVYDSADCCTNCTPRDLDHGVLLVGAGSENGKDYWIVKNSWGSRWGDSGFIKMVRNKNSKCGVATMAAYPIV